MRLDSYSITLWKSIFRVLGKGGSMLETLTVPKESKATKSQRESHKEVPPARGKKRSKVLTFTLK